MTALLRRIGRISVRAVFVALIALAFVQVIVLTSARVIRPDDPAGLLAPPIIRQAAAAARLIDGLAPGAEGDALTALQSPMLRFVVLPDFEATPPAENPQPIFVPIIEAYREGLGERPFSVYRRSERHLFGLRAWDPTVGRLTDELIIVMRLADGRALAVEAGAAYRRQIFFDAVAVTSVALAFGILALLVWASVSYAGPIQRIASAAARFSRRLDAAPLSVRGPKPVRDLAEALNHMQAELKARMAERTNTLAAVAHDLRTYLTRLRMRAEFIEDPAQRDKAVRDVEDMTALVEDSLFLARDPRADGETARLDLTALLTDAAARRREMGASVALATPEGAAAIARIAGGGVGRALDNLLDNALRYAGAAELSLTVDGDQARVAVRDRGPGVPEAKLAQITAPFERLEPSRSRETGGAGLGLAIAKAMIERAGGALTLANRDGGGLEASFELPLADAAAPAEA